MTYLPPHSGAYTKKNDNRKDGGMVEGLFTAMKLVSKISAVKLPEKMEIDGRIVIEKAEFNAIANLIDVIDSFKISMKLKINCMINGFQIDEFDSNISHTLSKDQFEQFLEKLSHDRN